jgi:hypothetical protein
VRLLAMEVYETLNHMGVYCDLVRSNVGAECDVCRAATM